MNHTFNKDHTNIVKGLAIMIIVCHHVFWNALIIKGDGSTKILFSDLTIFVTRWGFCCNHVFAAITGFGIAASIKSKKPLRVLYRREISVISLAIPVYIVASIVFILFCGGFDTFFNIYHGSSSKSILNIFLDMIGLSDAFQLRLLNPIWWYFSAVHVFTIALIMICVYFENRQSRHGFLFMAIIWFITMIINPILYGCMMLAALSGFLINYYNLIDKITYLFHVSLKNRFIGYITEFLFIFSLFYFWYFFVKKEEDPHLVSAILLPLPFFLLAKEFVYRIPIVSKGLMFIGKYSAYIFMIHGLIYSVYPFSRRFVYSFEYGIVTYIIVLMISLGVGIVMEKILRIIGYKKMINTLKEK